MKKEIVISGFGGQGGLAIGKNLAEAGMAEGLNVTWAPSYGPEMRASPARACGNMARLYARMERSSRVWYRWN